MTKENGGKKLSEEHKARIDKVLQDYQNFVGLTNYSLSNKVKYYLDIPSDKIGKLTRDDCAEGALLLNRYSIYLQQEYNKHHAIYNWANTAIKITLADRTPQYNSYSYEERRLQATKENPYTSKLYQIKSEAKTRMTMLEFLSGKVSQHSRIYQTLIGVKNETARRD